MIHIVFNEADVIVLEKVVELDETLNGEIIQVKDDYAVGPLQNIYNEEGKTERYNWWGKVLEGTDTFAKWESKEVNDSKTVENIIDKLILNPNEIVWIWSAQNKHDVCGYYWLMSQLKEYQGRVFILYLNNLPFFNEKGQIFYPEWLSQIPATEFLKAKKLARLITLSEFEIDPDEWLKICEENEGIRLLEGGKKIVSKKFNFYDTELKSFISNDFQKATKIINNFLTKAKHLTGDSFLLWRLKEMLLIGILEAQGNLSKIKELEFKKLGKEEKVEN